MKKLLKVLLIALGVIAVLFGIYFLLINSGKINPDFVKNLPNNNLPILFGVGGLLGGGALILLASRIEIPLEEK